MDRDESWQVIDRHRTSVADLLAGLTDDQWEQPSLCAGWRVRDVGAHLSLAATAGNAEVVRAVVAARGSFDRMIRDASIARASRPYAAIVADLRGIVGSRRLAPGTLWRDPLLDVLVHAQDLSRPLGLRVTGPVEAEVRGRRVDVAASVPVLPRATAARLPAGGRRRGLGAGERDGDPRSGRVAAAALDRSPGRPRRSGPRPGDPERLGRALRLRVSGRASGRACPSCWSASGPWGSAGWGGWRRSRGAGSAGR